MITWLPLLVCIIGLIFYCVSDNAKIVRLGEICFGIGLLVTLLHLAATANVLR